MPRPDEMRYGEGCECPELRAENERLREILEGPSSILNTEWMERVARGAIKSAIDAHGAIGLYWLGSAGKRVSHIILGEIRNKLGEAADAAKEGDREERSDARPGRLRTTGRGSEHGRRPRQSAVPADP